MFQVSFSFTICDNQWFYVYKPMKKYHDGILLCIAEVYVFDLSLRFAVHTDEYEKEKEL